MSVTDISEARRRREDRRAAIVAAADWVLHHVPLTQACLDDPELQRRWPDFDAGEWAEVGREIDRRMVIQLPNPCSAADLDAAVADLSGRYELWSRASNWLIRYWPARDIDHPEFERHFGEMTRAEVLLAAVDTARRRLRALGAIP